MKPFSKMTARQRVASVHQYMVPPAVQLLIGVYAGGGRPWARAHHRRQAATRLVEIAERSSCLREARDLMLNESKAGPIVEAQYAFGSARKATTTEPVPLSEIEVLRWCMRRHDAWADDYLAPGRE